MAKPEKATAVAEITERFKEADATLLTEYRGLRVSELAELRTALREANADYKVLKNTLTRIAVREVGIEGIEEMLTGPTAVVFVRGDVAAAAKALDAAAKKYPVLVVKGGTLKGGKTFDAAQASALAKIEPREVLLTKMAMLMNSPAQQTANVLSALLRNFGSMLAQVVTKKESGELPGGMGESPAEPETPAGEAEKAPVAPEEEAPAPSPDAAAEGDPSPGEPDDAGTPTEDQAEGEAADAPAAEATETSTDSDEEVKEEEE
ncbi:MAG: 50S ribosomal protein L10 [Actinomycetota bacterium]